MAVKTEILSVTTSWVLAGVCESWLPENALKLLNGIFQHCWLPSVLWHCWLGNRKGIRPVINWVLVCWWWWFD